MEIETETIKNEIRDLLGKMGFGESIQTIEAHQGATRRFSVHTAEDAPMLIGERGTTLSAIEYILKKILQKKYTDIGSQASSYVAKKTGGFTLDINDYRMKGLEELKQEVKSAAREVRLYRKDVPLRYMSSFERRIVHLLLVEYPDIITESIGQEPMRRVIIKPYP